MTLDTFVGKWESISMENWETLMKTLEVGWIMRKAASRAKTYHEVALDGEVLTWKWWLSVKHGEASFKLGDEFEETTPDGRKVKSKMWLEEEVLKQIQAGAPADTHIDRSIQEDGTMLEVLKANDVVCTRVYQKTE